MISKTLTIFVLGLLLAIVAHGEPRLVDHKDAAPEPARLLKGSKGGKSSKGKGGSRLLKASKSTSGKSGKRARYLKGSKSGKSCKGSSSGGSGCGKGARE